MKNLPTSIHPENIKKMFAGLILMLLYSAHSFSQLSICNAHFFHHSYTTGNVAFGGAFNLPGTTYAWDFGDGSTSTQHHPLHQYATPGAYYVCLTVTRTDTAGAVLCTAS